MKTFILQAHLLALLVTNTFAFTSKFKIAIKDLTQIDGIGDDPDAFVIVSVNGQMRFTTDAIHTEKNPAWNQVYALTGLNDLSRVSLEIRDYDNDYGVRSKLHGIITMMGKEFREVGKVNNDIGHDEMGRLIIDIRSVNAD